MSAPCPGVLVSILLLWQMPWPKATLGYKKVYLIYNSRLQIVHNRSMVIQASGHTTSSANAERDSTPMLPAACLFKLTLTLTQLRAEPRKLCHTQSTWVFHLNGPSENYPTCMQTGQPDLQNSALRFPSQLTLGWVKLTIKVTQHTWMSSQQQQMSS